MPILAETLGIKKTEQIFYHALLHYYSRGMKFTHARAALKKSCKKLFSKRTANCSAVDKAWESVGVK